MTQESANKFLRSEEAQASGVTEIHTTSDDRVFIRKTEARAHVIGELDPDTKPLEDKTIHTWFLSEDEGELLPVRTELQLILDLLFHDGDRKELASRVTELQRVSLTERTSMDDLYKIEEFNFVTAVEAMLDSTNTEDWNRRRSLVSRRYYDEVYSPSFLLGAIDGTGVITKVLGKTTVFPSNYAEVQQEPKRIIHLKR